ncbi:hypothetical protein K458DRAFT_392438 [Lentithecium fluviatile CBS 122367]|uniref:Uncharacterized protein n=1 Tax=Lentithecium fluviatile CBS 122367 TaxID=1168545 RepID=A0A6G1IR89_9PLEO|nr:hypothetical protein K458DRAFT_392438 [Lentithecium fluviatile CBS 122367]
MVTRNRKVAGRNGQANSTLPTTTTTTTTTTSARAVRIARSGNGVSTGYVPTYGDQAGYFQTGMSYLTAALIGIQSGMKWLFGFSSDANANANATTTTSSSPPSSLNTNAATIPETVQETRENVAHLPSSSIQHRHLTSPSSLSPAITRITKATAKCARKSRTTTIPVAKYAPISQPTPVTIKPSPAPVEIEDPVAEDARLRKEFMDIQDANRKKIFALPSFVRDRLEQGLPAWEPSGDSGLTTELEDFNRQSATARLVAQHRQQQQQQQQLEQESLRQLAYELEKRAALARLHQLGCDLTAVLGLMSDALDAGDAQTFGQLAQMTAIEGLKPVHDILVVLPLDRFDVFAIEWPLEKLEAAVETIKQNESSIPAELATQLVDFVLGFEACGQILAAVLSPPGAQQQQQSEYAPVPLPVPAPISIYGPSANVTAGFAPQEPAPAPPPPITSSNKQLLIDQMSIESAGLSQLVATAVKAVGAREKLRAATVRNLTAAFEAKMRLAGGDGRGWVLAADEGTRYRAHVNELVKAFGKMVPEHQLDPKIVKLKAVAVSVRNLWG